MSSSLKSFVIPASAMFYALLNTLIKLSGNHFNALALILEIRMRIMYVGTYVIALKCFWLP